MRRRQPKLARSAGASPAQVRPYRAAWKRVLREAAVNAEHEAYTVVAWGVGLSHERLYVAGAESFHSLEGNTCGTVMRGIRVHSPSPTPLLKPANALAAPFGAAFAPMAHRMAVWLRRITPGAGYPPRQPAYGHGASRNSRQAARTSISAPARRHACQPSTAPSAFESGTGPACCPAGPPPHIAPEKIQTQVATAKVPEAASTRHFRRKFPGLTGMSINSAWSRARAGRWRWRR
jgi:hypothetical protein